MNWIFQGDSHYKLRYAFEILLNLLFLVFELHEIQILSQKFSNAASNLYAFISEAG